MSLSSIQNCADCGSRNPKWASSTFAIYLCLDCAGLHREMGVHNSFVRSLNLDTWYPDQLSRMAIGGNSRAASYFRARGAGTLKGRARYSSKAAEAYRRALDKAAAEQPLDLSNYQVNATAASHDLLSPEPELDWEDSVPGTSSFDSVPVSVPSSTSTPPPRTASASASHTLTYKGFLSFISFPCTDLTVKNLPHQSRQEFET